MRTVAFTLLMAATAAQAQLAPSMPSVASRPGAAPAATAPDPQPAPAPGATSTLPAAAGTGSVGATGPAALPQRRESAISMPVDPRGGSWQGVAPQEATLDSVVNSGAPVGRGRMPQKVCPPGLFNRDGNCVAPASAIMK